MPTPEPIDATTLRRLADWAHSVRHPTAKYLVVHNPSPAGRAVELVDESNHDPASHIVIPIRTEPRAPRVELSDVGLHVPGVGGGRTVKLSELFPDDFPDALFWTDSAVQKFMLPYYASKLSAHEKVAALLDALLKALGPKSSSAAPAGDNDPIALVHLPNSEYTTADAGSGSGGVRVLCRDAKEGLVSITLDEYAVLLAKREGAEEGVAGQEGA